VVDVVAGEADNNDDGQDDGLAGYLELGSHLHRTFLSLPVEFWYTDRIHDIGTDTTYLFSTA
jgi:hypothetical protein